MKTLFLTSTLPRFHGDMQANFVGEQAQAWIAARAMDEIVILAPHDAGIAREERIGRVRIERFRYLVPERWQNLAYPAILPNIQRNPMLALQVPFFLAAEYRSAKQIAQQMKPDLVYAHWVMPQGLVAWRLKRKAGIPYVLQNHSSDLAMYLKLGRPGKAMARAVLGDAAHFFCVNAAQRDFALGLFDGAEREAFAVRCTVLPMGIAGLRKVAIPQQVAGFEIATIGRLSRKKGLNYLIEAAELLAQKGIRPSIGIAGDGEDRAKLEALVKQADVTFTGFLVGEEKERFLQTAQRFAFPARAADGDVEGLPVAMLEALCRQRPILASRDTNIELLPEWRQIRDCVTLVESPMDVAALAQGLERLLQSDRARAEAAAEIMGRYRWERLIGEYLAQIEAALSAAK